MILLSYGAGQQSTALALMSCENKYYKDKGRKIPYPLVPIYDGVIFCDLGEEPVWVCSQVDFVKMACKSVGIPFYTLETNLYNDYMKNFGHSRIVSIPFWGFDENGRKIKMLRHCTLDYKVDAINKFVRQTLLGYKKGQRTKPEDIKGHEMHLGFSYEEKRRARSAGRCKLFEYKYPLIEMGMERKDSYKYCLEVWGLKTKASACNICPFHRNYFFKYLKEHHPESYKAVVTFDNMLEEKQPDTKIRSKIFISRSRKRIVDLTDEDCDDAETFEYEGELIWNGF